MEQFWKDVGIAFVMGFLVPAVLLGAIVSLTVKRPDIQDLTEPIIISDASITSETADAQRKIALLSQDGHIEQILLCDYLTGVVLAEMPVSFEPEALKAQSVVARTYTMRAVGGASKHAGADVCTDSACCQGYAETESYLRDGGTWEDVQYIRKLVSATDGLVLTYDGSLIEATYFSCSGGMTEDAVAVWGTEVPYLQSVPSPGEEGAAHYTDTVIYTFGEFASRMGLPLSSDAAIQITDVSYTNGGGVERMIIDGQAFTGTQLRKLLDLRSTAFTLTADEAAVTIQTRGYGHRVGMSQYGAEAMAVAGSTYAEILSYYYKGTELTRYTD